MVVIPEDVVPENLPRRDGRSCYWVGVLPGTTIQERATRIRKPTPIPKVPAAPILPTSALLQNPPTNNAKAAKVLWSRETTLCRSLSRRGSAISSTQIVVSTTTSIIYQVLLISKETAQQRTGGSELWIQPFPLYTLQTQAHAHECKADERQGVRPSGISPVIRDTQLAAFPDGDGSSHREQGLNKCTANLPDAFRRPYPVPDPTNERSEIKSDQGT
jgi:hypothetical protein